MTWTYSVSDLGTSQKDDVRMLIGDTDVTSPQLQDEEIGYALVQRPSLFGAAALCCRSLAAKYAISVTTAAGDTKLQNSDISKAYARLAASFDAQAAQSGAGLPYAGGISVTDKQSVAEDSDRVEPQFTIGLDDNYLPIAPVDEGGSTEFNPLGNEA